MTGTMRTVCWLGFFAAVLLSWLLLYRMSMMAGLDLVGIRRGANMMPMESLAALFGMWVLMMAAMMLPTLVPTLTTYDDLIRAADGTRAGWLGVLGGYFVIWLGMAGVLALAQLLLRRAGLIDALGLPASGWISAGLLVAVGLYQFTPLKDHCHAVCHSPMRWFLMRWRPGAAGGLRMGAGLGVYCAGCCWGFMALGFAGGTMNLMWMGLATLFMVLEKLPQIAHRVVRPLGGALVAGGVAVAAVQLAGTGTTG